MKDDIRPQFKPEPETESAYPDESAEIVEATLADNHPFARLVGHDPQLMQAMAAALRVLQNNTQDEVLGEKIRQAESGKLAFAELLDDDSFAETFNRGADQAKTVLDETREGLSDEEREVLDAQAKAHVDRLTGHGQLLSEVKKAFGHLAE